MIEGLLYDDSVEAYWVWIEGFMAGQGSHGFSFNLRTMEHDPRDEYDVLSIPKEFL